jgi:hypothetical protein
MQERSAKRSDRTGKGGDGSAKGSDRAEENEENLAKGKIGKRKAQIDQRSPLFGMTVKETEVIGANSDTAGREERPDRR